MKTLKEPSGKLSVRVLSKVAFEDRFIGYRLGERHGAGRTTCYSFQEIVNLLKDRMPRVDFDALQKWVKKVMGDAELAERIVTAVEEEGYDYARTLRIRNLMQERLAQCRKIV